MTTFHCSPYQVDTIKQMMLTAIHAYTSVITTEREARTMSINISEALFLDHHDTSMIFNALIQLIAEGHCTITFSEQKLQPSQQKETHGV